MTPEHKKDYNELMKKEEKKIDRYIKNIKKQILDPCVLPYLEECLRVNEKKEIIEMYRDLKKTITVRDSDEYSE